ncbi:DNA-directed RNA polymerase subunit beta' [Trichinella pseudospiralis]
MTEVFSADLSRNVVVSLRAKSTHQRLHSAFASRSQVCQPAARLLNNNRVVGESDRFDGGRTAAALSTLPLAFIFQSVPPPESRSTPPIDLPTLPTRCHFGMTDVHSLGGVVIC